MCLWVCNVVHPQMENHVFSQRPTWARCNRDSHGLVNQQLPTHPSHPEVNRLLRKGKEKESPPQPNCWGELQLVGPALAQMLTALPGTGMSWPLLLDASGSDCGQKAGKHYEPQLGDQSQRSPWALCLHCLCESVPSWVPWDQGYTSSSSLFGEDNGTPLQYSCLENPMDAGAWWAAVHGVAKRHDWVTSLSLFTFMHSRRKWQPTPVFLPRESQGQGSLVGCRLWGHTELDTTEVT